MLQEQTLKTISDLLYKGNFGLTLEQNQNIVVPIINEIAKEIDSFGKKEEKKDK